MTISYPISLPSARGPSRIIIRANSIVGVSQSPFTGEQEVYVHQGESWQAEVSLPPMHRADAEEWIGAFLLALNGREGTFLMGDPVNTTPRGSWLGASPLVNGASQSGKTLAIDGLAAGATGKAGDWLQLGTGSSTHLHKLTAPFTANGSGQATLDIWPRLRAAPADNAAVTIASPKGLWRLTSNVREWSIDIAQIYGLNFSCVEAL